MQLHIGQKVGNYRIVDEIAQGAYAYVYKAIHSFLSQRPVALKILHKTFVDPGAEHDVLYQEAKILEQLRHPHILSLIEFGTYEGAPYIVKEYAPEGSLRDRLRQLHGHPLPLAQALTVLRQIGDGLQFAHAHNVVHCDLKPENILFNAENEALIADFDIARVLKSVKAPGVSIGGTPSYMAPEQFLGKVRYESDQYALACMAYEMVTGKRPFEGDDLATLKQKHLHEAPLPPSQLSKGLPQHIEQAILRGMEKKYTARFKDVAAFVNALDAHQNAGTTSVDWPASLAAPQHGKRLILHAPGTPKTARKTAPDDSIFYEETVAMNGETTLADADLPHAPRKRRTTSKAPATKKASARTKSEKATTKPTATKKAATKPTTTKKAPAKKTLTRAKSEKAATKAPVKKVATRAKKSITKPASRRQ